MMDHKEIVRLLPPYLDRELAGRTQVAVSEHLASCPACRRELEGLKADTAFLRSVEAPEPNQYLSTRVMAEIRQKGRTAPRRFGRLATTAGAALLVAVSIGVGVFFGSGLVQPGSTAAVNSTEAAVSYVESSTADMYTLMAGGY